MSFYFHLVAIALTFSSLFGEVPDTAWKDLDARFDEAQKEYQKAFDSLSEKSGKSDQAELEQEAIAYLRSLLIYESAVRILALPEDSALGLQKSREFSSQERRTIQKLRQEIRDADRARLLAALAADTDLSADADAAESILKDELRLDSYFKTNSRKIVSEISKLERQLGKLQGQTNNDDPRRQKVKDEIAQLKDEVATIHEAVFGFRAASGFREPAGNEVKGPALQLLEKIISEREKIFVFLKGEQPDGGEGEGKAGNVGGSFLYSSNLGVVLDISGSMTPHLKELRDEIESYFEAPRYREVEGCRLDSCHFEHLRTKRSPKTWATMSVMEELITVREVDTLYWFSDLMDDQDFMSVRRLRELLMRGGTRFHVKSLGKKPTRELDDIITDFQD